MTSIRSAWFAIPLLLAAAHGQRTIIVDARGGGQFTDIQPAIAASAPGDTILVRPSSYSGFALDRGVSILGSPGVVIDRGSSRIGVGVPAGQTAVIADLTYGLFGIRFVFTVFSSSGRVHLERVSSGLLQVSRSASVTLSDCTIGQLLLIESSVLLSGRGLVNGNAVEATDTRLVMSGVRLQPMLGQGLVLTRGSATVTADASITAGTLVPASAILNNGGTLVVDPNARLVPSGGAPPVTGQVTYAPVAASAATVANNTLSVTLTAPGALRGHTLLSLPLPGPLALTFGDLWIDPGAHLVLDSGTVPANGIRAAMFNLPPRPPGLLVAIQAIVAYPTGLGLSAARLALLD